MKLADIVTDPETLSRFVYALWTFNGSVFVESLKDLQTRIRGYRKEKAI